MSVNLQKSLTRWYVKYHRELPWRKTTDPYLIWISEVMLQQTRVDTVIPYYKKFIERFPVIGDLAESDLALVLKHWEGLGYYTRARNMHQAAGIICKEYGGKLPEDQEELLRLPGVGDYISAAVGSIAFHLPVAVIDGNVKRILARLFMESMPVNDSAAKKHFGDLALGILDRENPGQFNQAMMELGQRVCKPKGPDCGHCPLKKYCKACKNNMTASYPVKIPKKPVPLRKMIFAVVIRKGKWLIIRRPDSGLLGGLWEFPGKEIPPAQNSDDEVAGMVIQKAGIQIQINRKLGNVRHVYTHFRVSAAVYLCTYLSGTVQLNDALDHRWIQPGEMKHYPFHKMIHKMIPLIDCGTLLLQDETLQ